MLKFAQDRYSVTFQMHAKIDVNGSNAHPLYTFIKAEKPGLLGTKAIKWNFTKFLVDRQGKVIERFAPKTTPKSLSAQIEGLLAQRA
ncbi:glutathione peroxidase [Plesiocystis pacifica SIR-1]|uniref:Glutathione peroxidase n=1 Tax=Plesiocystis pacifica SIR-1 TaxID=391625 RepID=A6GIV8_9BACT|nr:glutathione peroxidase [Plesiocystis pacifica SIR-1]